MARETLRDINDRLEELSEQLGQVNARLRGLLDETHKIDEDEQRLIRDLEASSDEADRAALQLEAKELRTRWKLQSEEISQAQDDFEKLQAEFASLSARSDDVLVEAQKMSFEIAKHLTTLNTAAILVYLAAAREISLPLWIALLFVLSLAGATVSMTFTGLRGLSPRPTLEILGLAVAVSSFFVGLLYSVLHALLD